MHIPFSFHIKLTIIVNHKFCICICVILQLLFSEKNVFYVPQKYELCFTVWSNISQCYIYMNPFKPKLVLHYSSPKAFFLHKYEIYINTT